MNELQCLSIVVDIIAHLLTLVCTVTGLMFACKGLTTWRNQLKGESQYKLASDVLVELKTVINSIDNCRCTFYSESELGGSSYENRWSDVLLQNLAYSRAVTKLMVATQDYFVDTCNDKKLQDFIDDIQNARSVKNHLDKEREYCNEESNVEDRKRIMNEYVKINKILQKQQNDDVWRIGLQNYFEKVNDKFSSFLE